MVSKMFARCKRQSTITSNILILNVLVFLQRRWHSQSTSQFSHLRPCILCLIRPVIQQTPCPLPQLLYPVRKARSYWFQIHINSILRNYRRKLDFRYFNVCVATVYTASEVAEFTPGLYGERVAQSLVFGVYCIVDCWFSFSPFSCGNCASGQS